jgi:hypothetical protein
MSDAHAPQPPEPVRSPGDAARLERRVRQLEAFIAGRGWPVPADPGEAGAFAPPPRVPPRTAATLAEARPPADTGIPAAGPDAVDRASATGASWVERFVGMRLAAVAGGLAVLGALGLFIKYAVDNEWLGHLGPWARFGAGLVVAALLVGAAELAQRRWNRHAATGLHGAGVAALFVTVAGGILVLDLFDPWSGALVGLGAAVLGALIAARSLSLVVAFLGVAGGFALPAVSGVLSTRGVAGGAFLTAVLAVALGMVLAGPPRFAWLRVLALAAAVPLGLWWALESGTRDALLAVAVVVWWGMFTASCVVEALRGRSPRLNAAALVAASFLGSLAAVAALAGPSAWSSAFSYMPLGMAVCLGAVALQFRDAAGATGDAAGMEMGESPEVARALQRLGRAAAAVAPIALVTSLGLLLDHGAFAVCAAGLACALALGRDRVGGRWVAAPGVAVATVLALVAAGVELVPPWTGWQWSWPEPGGLGAMHGNDRLIAVHVGTRMIGALGAAVLLALPLARAERPGGLIAATAVGALVATLLVLAAGFGPWSGALVVAALAASAGGAGRAARRWVIPVGALLAAAIGAWWVVLGWAALDRFEPAPSLSVAVGVVAALAGACWALRRAAWEAWRPALEVAAVLVAVFGASAAVPLLAFDDPSREGSMALLLACLSAGSAGLALWARARRRASLALAALVPAVLAAAALMAAAVVATFAEPLPPAFGRTPVWSAPLAAPAGGLALALWAAGSLGGAPPWLGRLARGARPALLLAVWSGATVLLAVRGTGGIANPHLVIAALAVAGALALWRGFRGGVAAFRWVGLALFGLLALRLFVVDLRETSTLFRVGVLFATGLVLVGTSIAYTLVLKPRRGE